MRRLIVVLSLLLFCGHSCPVMASDRRVGRPDLVQEVMAGKRRVARASWWGFAADDSTDCLQQAINSRVRRLVIDRQHSPWVTRPLTGVSDQEIVVEAGAQLLALKGAFHGTGECLLSFNECRNVTIRGEKRDAGRSARISMRKRDYQSGAYEASEWRHGISLAGCRNVLIQDVTIEQTGGDGIYLGASPSTGANRNVVIRRVDCNGNHRQGISVISADGLLIDDCRLRNTKGTNPQAGIDFEPNSSADLLTNCVLRRCVSEGNAGSGFQICPQQMNSQSMPISITIEHCASSANGWHAVHLCSAQEDQPRGMLRIIDFRSSRDALAGLCVQFNPYDAMKVKMERVTVRDAALKDTFFPPIYIQGIGSETRPAGGIHFDRVTIEDNVQRPFLRVRDPGSRDITGQIMLYRNGARRAIMLKGDLVGNRLVTIGP